EQLAKRFAERRGDGERGRRAERGQSARGARGGAPARGPARPSAGSGNERERRGARDRDDGDSDREQPSEGERRWALTREQRLTYLPTLPPDNKLVAGKLWSDPAAHEVSLEEDYARELGARLGSRI